MSAARVLVLCPYPHGRVGSQRFRFEQYLPLLEARGFEVVQESFWDADTFSILYKKGHTAKKIAGVLRGMLRRARITARARNFDYVFIHLEAMPIGPPLVELALLLLGRKIIYDIDDVIYAAATNRENRLAAPVRWRSKVAFITRRSHKVIAVNPFLVDWAKQHRDEVQLVPTTIDPNYHVMRSERRRTGPLVLGWTGTKTTAPLLEIIRPALRRLAGRRSFTLRVIGEVDPDFSEIPSYEFVPWRKETEIADLHEIDIGLMPVPDTLASKGKVGFKAIQYGALGLPCVVSDVAEGPVVVRHEETGLVVPNETDAWVHALERLIDDPAYGERLGRAARDHIVARYSIPAQAPVYLSLFQ